MYKKKTNVGLQGKYRLLIPEKHQEPAKRGNYKHMREIYVKEHCLRERRNTREGLLVNHWEELGDNSGDVYYS